MRFEHVGPNLQRESNAVALPSHPRRPNRGRAAGSAFVALLCFALNVFAQPIVDPGSLEPQQPAPVLPSQTEDPIRVPVPSQRPTAQALGPKIPVSAFELAWEEPGAVAPEHQASARAMLRKRLDTAGGQLTIGELDTAADALTGHLRDAGYLLAKAILPPQQISDGAVKLRVFSGLAGDVIARSNELYSDGHIIRAFTELRGKPVRRETLEPRLLLLNELPGYSAVAVFEPGKETGTTTLGLQTTREEPLRYSARIDNYGVEATGDWRIGLGATVNNVTGHRDKLLVNALRTFSSGDLRNARARYEITLPKLVHTLGLGYSETRYDVEASAARALNIEGANKIAELDLLSRWFNSRTLSVRSEIGLSTKRAEQDLFGGATPQGVDKLTVLDARLVAEGVDQRLRGIYQASIGISRGFNDLLGSMDGQGDGNSLTQQSNSQTLPGQFRTLHASYNRLQSLAANQQLLLLFRGQYSNDQLASLEKMSLGGPYTVRAYPVGEFTADRALYTSLAWKIDGGLFSDGIAFGEYAWSQVLSLSIFADYGWGKNRDAGGGITRRELSGFGLGARAEFPAQRAFIDFSVAKPFAGKQANNGDEEQAWVQVGIDF